MRVSEAKLRHSDVQFDMPARMRVLRAAPPAVLLLFLLFPSAAEACGCGGRASSAVSVKAAAAVFTGTVEAFPAACQFLALLCFASIGCTAARRRTA